MPYINDDKKKEILDKSTLENTLNAYHPAPKKKGAQLAYDCPVCKKQEKLQYSKSKDIVSCFPCGIRVKFPVDYLMQFHGLSYPESLEELARIESISLEAEKPKSKPKGVRSKKAMEEGDHSFCANKLHGSGLTTDDVKANVYVDGETTKEIPTFRSGTKDERWEIITGDDIIISYYDLEGKPMYYYRKDKSGQSTGSRLLFRRIRFQYPELHKDKNGRPIKYMSPYGSDSKIYIPQAIRNKYKRGAIIKTLYIQEGELKAEKATKHKMMSVGVMGIHNIAYNKKLPLEFELIIKKCKVENVVFVLDEDWDRLSRKIDSSNAADMRPKNFYKAVLNFRNHFYAFTNSDIHLNIYFAHINTNEEGDKGIDDLLTNSLRGKENSLVDICNKNMLDPSEDHKWITFRDITTESHYKLLDYWGLQNKDSFVEKYFDQLEQLPEFKFGKVKYRIVNKEIELAQPLLDHEQYWNEEKAKNKTNYSFNYKRCYVFLQNRGFSRYEVAPRKWIWIHKEDNIVREVDNYQIKDYILDFTKQAINNEAVENMLYSGGNRYLGPDSMGNLEFSYLNLHLPGKGIQYLYFKNCYWKVTDEGFEQTPLKEIQGDVWKDKLRDFEPTKLPLLLKEVHKITAEDAKDNDRLKQYIGEYTIEFTEDGDRCHMLQFIMNTCRFTRKPIKDYDLDEWFHTSRHFLAKLTAIGYMLHRYRNAKILKAVVGMDAKMSEVGASNGRSGKSIIGMLLEHLIPTVTIPGKKRDLLEDRFIFEEVDERTECVFIDDVRMNFDIEALFPSITGKFTVEKKGLGKQTLPAHLPQKFYITTNHALKGEGGSFRSRQILLGFSDWYNEKYEPVDDFGVLFFDEWDTDQHNLCYNMAALCLHLYFKHGIIEAPQDELNQRKIRQDLGESFIDWANSYFSNPNNVNTRVLKFDMYRVDQGSPSHRTHGNGFGNVYPTETKWTNMTKFKEKLRKYASFKGWDYNPSTNGKDIKSSGKEYIEIHVPTELYIKLEDEARRQAEEDNPFDEDNETVE
ncbi:hypothetical protein [Aquimarina sp. AU58]|uniref:hypothetical protein n=1 Tax=Aquimarina sp. AU58 TaxID=1874112 RepID=UPI000D6EA3F2|nr:hypothetical protein [Aquimarina sp. AU58]